MASRLVAPAAPPALLHVLFPPPPPPNDGEDDDTSDAAHAAGLGGGLHTFKPVAECIERTRYYRERHAAAGYSCVVDAHVVPRCSELGVDVLELAVHAATSRSAPPCLDLPCHTALPLLTAHVGELGKHVEVSVSVETVESRTRRSARLLRFSTQCSLLKSLALKGGDDREVSLPLTLSTGGWSALELDCARATALAWGEQFIAAVRVRLSGSLRVARVYFADRHLANGALPPWLRQLPPAQPVGEANTQSD